MTTREEIRKRIAADGIEFLLVQFVDMHGAAKVKMVPASKLDSMIDSGAGFAGAAVQGMGQGPHSHDMLARIDLDTYAPLTWRPNTARFASNLFVDGEPHPYCPRTNLMRMLDIAASRGLRFNVGMEPEHFLVVRNEDGSISPWNPDLVDTLSKPCYDFRSVSPAMDYLQEVTNALNTLDWGVYQADHEDANGQYEINFDYADALVTADRVTFFKMATSQIAKKYGAIATYMPKPFADRTGSALHVHFHVADVKTNENVFLDEGDGRNLGLSQLAYHFIGGILSHARALAAVCSPTINCYKRLQVGEGLTSGRSGFTWTPAFVSYGDNNRTQMIRTAGPGHCEDRTLSSGCNPYLALAAYLAAGLDGIDKKLDPGEPNLGNLYEEPLAEIRKRGIDVLPQSLGESLGALREDEVVQGGLGVASEEFIKSKVNELAVYDGQVTPWEIDSYLTFV